MDQDVQPKAEAPAEKVAPADPAPPPDPVDEAADESADQDAHHERDERVTRVVHVVLGLVIAAFGAWLLYRSHTELAFRGGNGEPGPGYLPVLLTTCLVGMGLLLSAVWLFGSKARHAEATSSPGR
jgi:hypothetical protein